MTLTPGCTRGLLRAIRMNKELYEQLLEANYITLQYNNRSTRARKLSNMTHDHLINIEQRKRCRKSKDAESFRLTLQTIIPDLIDAYWNSEGGWAFRSLCSNKFESTQTTVVVFRQVIRLMQRLDYLESVQGNNRSNCFHAEGASKYVPGLATRFRLTSKFMSLVSDTGITEDNFYKHYKKSLTIDVLRKKASSVTYKNKKVSGKRLVVERTAHTEYLKTQVRNINEYLAKQNLANASFSGYYRTFNQADLPNFSWNKGGRLTDPGVNSYQKMPKQERLELIKINDEQVAEVDISSSYLSIFMSLMGESLPDIDDLYAVPGIDREIVKAYITAYFGKGAPLSRWGHRAVSEFKSNGIFVKNLTASTVGARIFEYLPVLSNLKKSRITWADLMFIESQGMIKTIETLRDDFNIPALSMHDGLIVPMSGAKLAEQELKRAFSTMKISCRVKILSRQQKKSPKE